MDEATEPRYDGKYLHELVKNILGDKRLHDTLTHVVIPTFDIKLLQPAIFSSYEVTPTSNISLMNNDAIYVYPFKSSNKIINMFQ